MPDEEGDGGLIVGGELVLTGFVGDAWMGEGFDYAQVRRALARIEGPVTVRLNSGGGFATDGAAIMAALEAHPAEVTVVVEGIAASAASLIAMAGDRIVMAHGALMMIHDPRGVTLGDAAAHRETAERLDKLADTYARTYARRSGMSESAVRELMVAETWMDGAEAVAAGFADAVEEPGREEPAVAAFDFTIYARAPEWLADRAKWRGWRFAASMARPGAARKREEAGRMPKDEQGAPGGAAVMADGPAPAGAQAMNVDGKAEAKARSGADAGGAPDTASVERVAREASERAVAEERARVTAINRTGHQLGLDRATVDSMIAEGLSADAARARMIDAWADRGDRHEYGAPAAEPRSNRLDERETMRTGVAAAIMARMDRSAPATDAARPYMEMSLPQMAQAVLGERGPLLSYGERERVMMSAMHSTGDFPLIFENVLHQRLAARYAEATPTYRRIARQMEFADFRPHPLIRAGDFPTLQEVSEAGEIKFGTFSESKETAAVVAYGRAISITRQMMVNDRLGAIAQVIADQGRAVARFEDATFYAMMLSGANADGPQLLETGRQIFNTTDASKAGSGAKISVTSLSAGREAIRTRTGLDGAPLDLIPAILLAGPAKETEAAQLLSPIGATEAVNVNPFSGRLQPVITPHISGNAWFLLADPADAPAFYWGLLDGYEAPRVRTEEPFGRQGMSLSVEHDFGCAGADFRPVWKNPGA